LMMAMTIFMGIDPRLCPSPAGAGHGQSPLRMGVRKHRVARQRMGTNQAACQFAASIVSGRKQKAFSRYPALACGPALGAAQTALTRAQFLGRALPAHE
jgi:hypothetical protein